MVVRDRGVVVAEADSPGWVIVDFGEALVEVETEEVRLTGQMAACEASRAS